MKIRNLLRHAFIAFTVLCIDQTCVLLLIYDVGALSFLENLEYAYAGSGLLIVGIFLWAVYRSMQDEYGNLENAPLKWLIVLTASSSLLMLAGLFDYIWFLTQYIPYVIKKNQLLTYILFLQFSILAGIIDSMPFLMTYRMMKALRKKLHQTAIIQNSNRNNT